MGGINGPVSNIAVPTPIVPWQHLCVWHRKHTVTPIAISRFSQPPSIRVSVLAIDRKKERTLWSHKGKLQCSHFHFKWPKRTLLMNFFILHITPSWIQLTSLFTNIRKDIIHLKIKETEITLVGFGWLIAGTTT